MYSANCSKCGYYSSDLREIECPSCHNPLSVHIEQVFKAELLRKNDYSAWRYAEFFPYVEKKGIITLGEGWTPLVKKAHDVFLKIEGSNPTGSFKDRGSTVMISALWKMIKQEGGFLSEDSSGNAGASIAAYAARAGLKARIYVPKSVAGPKYSQIKFYGAEVRKTPGSRTDVTLEAQRIEEGKAYVGHVYSPLFRDGIRSLAYELTEQFGWKDPGTVYVPVSAGTLLLGIIEGFSHLVDSSVLGAVPKIVACQSSQASPLYHRFQNLPYSPPERVTSVADALVSTDPPLLDLMIQRLKQVNGDAVMVEEHEIIHAFRVLAKEGFFVEPSSAVAYAAFLRLWKNGHASRRERAVIVLTGSGLKTMLEPPVTA